MYALILLVVMVASFIGGMMHKAGLDAKEKAYLSQVRN